jgi:hypothetical protein
MRQAATSLRYRDFIIVGLIVNERDTFDDNWIYIHDPRVRVGRIQNIKSWSPQMNAEYLEAGEVQSSGKFGLEERLIPTRVS